MINKMESSCCHGDLKHSGQAQACAENGLIGEDTDDWGLDHKGPAVPGLIRSRVSARRQEGQRGARGSVLGGAEQGGAAGGEGEMLLATGKAEVAEH